MKPIKSLSPAPAPRRILVPIDFSPCSLGALGHALTLAKQNDAEIILLHINQPPQAGWMIETAGLNRALAEVNSACRQQLEELAGNHVRPLARVAAMTRTGTPAAIIVSQAQKLGADLIVMGTHGRARLRKAIIGSTAERVTRHSTCPVMVVPTPVSRRKLPPLPVGFPPVP